MPEPISSFLDSTRLLFDLQQSNKIAERFAGCLDPQVIARHVTDGLVDTFDCAFARLWLVEPDRITLRLVASSGMYTHVDGSFARVAMGAFKVGKIAQNRIPFLSNNLANETWVKDRDWAIAQNISGFAGYPLLLADEVVGVLAVFSHQPMQAEFLEVLQGLCTTVTVSLKNALQYQQERRSQDARSQPLSGNATPLSEHLATVLQSARLTLVGTERPLTVSLTYVLLRLAEVLTEMECHYCRLTYGADAITLEAMVDPVRRSPQNGQNGQNGHPNPAAAPVNTLGDLQFAVACLGGELQTHTSPQQKVLQVLLSLPYPACRLGPSVRVQCKQSVLQVAFTHLAYLAGLTLADRHDGETPLVTDDITQVGTAKQVLWISHDSRDLPKGVNARVDLSIQPAQLRQAVEALLQGQRWGLDLDAADTFQSPSDREQEIMTLLAQGLRDRDIAQQLFISDRTVKFHINNILTKLQARTRFQALYRATLQGWITVDEVNAADPANGEGDDNEAIAAGQ